MDEENNKKSEFITASHDYEFNYIIDVIFKCDPSSEHHDKLQEIVQFLRGLEIIFFFTFICC